MVGWKPRESQFAIADPQRGGHSAHKTRNVLADLGAGCEILNAGCRSGETLETAGLTQSASPQQKKTQDNPTDTDEYLGTITLAKTITAAR